MSIFKETLDEGIQTQLQARTLVVSGVNNNRSNLLPWYLSKNAWVRMTSFVNYTEGTIYPDGEGSLKVDDTTGHYKGNQLSKKYILEGGTLYTKMSGSQTVSSLRNGVATANAVYGSDIDIRPDGTADPRYLRQQGLRPMPGITDVRMRTIGAYGSLFETTINFHAWDTNQLNELELLFMRPGYSVLLEWGWSQYISYNNTGSKNNLSESDIYQEKFLGQTINPFDPNLTQDAVYSKLEELRGKYRYNYDGMLGYIKNFNWKLRRDGGYDCSTTLISMGEMINTLKMNTNANNFTNSSDRIPDQDDAASYVFDDFENVLLSLKSTREKTTEGDTVIGESGAQTVLATNNYISESAYFGVWEENLNYVSLDTIKTRLKNDLYIDQANYLGTEYSKNPFYQFIENTSNTNYGVHYEYLTLDVVIALIGSYVNLRSVDAKGREFNTVRILPPSETDYCLAGPDSISVQPAICNVFNPGAFKQEIKYFVFPGAGTGPSARYKKSNGVIPKIYSFYKKFYDPTIKAGKIKNILVNIDFLLNVYKDLKSSSNESGVIMTDYLKNVLNKISNALGGLNNFTLSTAGKNQNTLRIIDTYYFGQEKKDDTYQFDLLGLGSICKDVSIQSQIFQEQSTIVAIAAQSKANLGDVYNSTQIYLNAGLEDRLAKAKWQGSELYSTSNANIDDPFYAKLAQLMAYARNYLIGFTKPNDYVGKIQVSDNGTDPHTLLKSALLRYDGEMNFKALIPFKLRITLEGIGGIVVGQIFTVKQNILPKNYYDKNLGFIVTQIEHVLKGNQWETILDTQICILDQQNFYDAEGRSLVTGGIKREGFGDYLSKRQIIGIIWPVLIDYMIYQATRSLVGYIYSATDSSGGKKGYKGTVTFRENVLRFNNNNVTDYWKNNVGKFTNRFPSARSRTGEIFSSSPLNAFAANNVNSETNLSRVFSLDGRGFEEFFLSWCKVWTRQNGNILTNSFSETRTFGDVMEFMTNISSWGENPDPEFKNFQTYIDAAKKIAYTIPLEAFYPNTSEVSIYSNGGIIDFGKYGEAPSGSLVNNSDIPNTSVLSFNHAVFKNNPNQIYSPYVGIRGWNYNKIYQKFDEILVQIGDTQIQTIFRNYNSNITVGNLESNDSITKYFYPNSEVMYGKEDSLVITNSNVEQLGESLNSFAFNEFNSNIESAKNVGFKYLFPTDPSSRSTTQTWAQTIDWNSYYRSDINDPSTTNEINAKWFGTDRPDYFWENIEF